MNNPANEWVNIKNKLAYHEWGLIRYEQQSFAGREKIVH